MLHPLSLFPSAPVHILADQDYTRIWRVSLLSLASCRKFVYVEGKHQRYHPQGKGTLWLAQNASY